MKLLWLLYRGRQSRYILLLELGEFNGKICGIDTKKINDRDRIVILSAAKTLENMQLRRLVAWVKRHCPGAMAGYREIFKEKAQIMSTHAIGELNVR